MAVRRHLIAGHGVPVPVWERFLESPGARLGDWRVSAAAGVHDVDAARLDHRLGLASRASGGLVLRATTVDDEFAAVCLQRDGRRVALFDHPFGGLRVRDSALPALDGDENGDRRPSLNAPIPRDRLGDLDDGDDEILARLVAGESPQDAWRMTTRKRADRLAGLTQEAGVEGVDAERILVALRGDHGARATAEEDESGVEHIWGDLPVLLEAMGLTGLREFLGRPGGWPPGSEEEQEEDATLDDEGFLEGAPEDSPPGDVEASWRRWPRVACGLLLGSLMVGGALAGALLADRFDSPLATLGGAAAGFVAVPLVLIVLLLLGTSIPAILLGWKALVSARRTRENRSAPLRKTWIRDLPPRATEPGRRAIADWTELHRELEGLGTRARPGLLEVLWGDALLPTGESGRELLEALQRPHGVDKVGRKLGELRLELLDCQIAERPTGDLAVRVLQAPR